MTGRLLLRKARHDDLLVDIVVEDGLVAAVHPWRNGDNAESETILTVVDLDGRLVLPPLVNGHAHLDKTFWGLPWRPHRVGRSVQERVAHERAIRSAETDPQGPRSSALGLAMARSGVGHVRTHVDVDTLVGLAGLEAVLQARAAVSGEATVQIVAFPQSGILADPGVADLMAEAMSAGADVVGGLDPWGYDGDVSRHLDVVFGLAAKHDAPVDVHLHDRGRRGLDEIEEICARTLALGMQNRVSVSHAYALGAPGDEEIGPTLERCARAGVAIMTDGPVGMAPPVEQLRHAGVTVFSGSDGIRDAWSPYGVPGMMQIAHQIAYQNQVRSDDDFATVLDVVTRGGADALGIGDYGIAVGRPADIVVVDATCAAEAVAGEVEPSLVLRAGVALPPPAESTRFRPLVQPSW